MRRQIQWWISYSLRAISCRKARKTCYRDFFPEFLRRLLDERTNGLVWIFYEGLIKQYLFREIRIELALQDFLAHFFRLTFRFLRSEEHTSELQSQSNLVCRLLLLKKKNKQTITITTHTTEATESNPSSHTHN